MPDNSTPDNLDRIWSVFEPATLARICEADELTFPQAYGLTKTTVKDQPAPDDWYAFRNNGSSILAVAHLDTVSRASDRRASFVETAAGPVVYSRALDDRLGAYTILELLPRLGVNVDVLLTVGEESGRSTAAFFTPPNGKRYDWVIEFDRGGTDVVLYQYDDLETRELVKASGARVGDGIWSDIACLEHLGVKAFNWGIGYQDYHSARSHAFLDDTFDMVDCFLTFHEQNVGVRLDHVEEPASYSPYGRRTYGLFDADAWDDEAAPTYSDYPGAPDDEDEYERWVDREYAGWLSTHCPVDDEETVET